MSGRTQVVASAELSKARRWSVLAVCACALFLVGLDTTVVAVGLSSIGGGLDADPTRLAWVIDAYTVVFASLLMTAGALADRFGRRRVFVVGLVVFGASSLACAAAQSFPMLLAARAVQGMGASMLTPVALAIVVSVMTDPRERALAIGVWGSVFGLSMAAGPVVGGALLSVSQWRALFAVNVPVVALALVLVIVLVPSSRAPRPRPLDLPGQVLLVALLATAVAVLIEVPRVGWGGSRGLTALVVLVLLGWVFVRVEARRAHPLIEPRLFTSPSFTGAVLGAVAVFVGFSLTLLLCTALLQQGRGMSPLAAGAATLPMAVAATVCAPVSGAVVGRWGPRVPLAAAGVLFVVGAVLFSSVGPVGGLLRPLAAFFVIGAAVGLANAPITNTAVNGLPTHRAGVAGGTTSTARQCGTALGAAIAGALVAGVPASGLASATRPGWALAAACGVVLVAVSAWGRPGGAQTGSEGSNAIRGS